MIRNQPYPGIRHRKYISHRDEDRHGAVRIRILFGSGFFGKDTAGHARPPGLTLQSLARRLRRHRRELKEEAVFS